MTRSALTRAAFALTLAAAPVAAFAAPAPQAAQSAAPLPQAMEQKIDAHINMLHKQLAITPDQEAQWNQFAQVMHDNAAAMHAALDDRGTKISDMNAADNMQSYAELARVHADNMQKLAASFQTLYGSLSDSQKHTADTVFRHEEGRHAGHHKMG